MVQAKEFSVNKNVKDSRLRGSPFSPSACINGSPGEGKDSPVHALDSVKIRQLASKKRVTMPTVAAFSLEDEDTQETLNEFGDLCSRALFSTSNLLEVSKVGIELSSWE